MDHFKRELVEATFDQLTKSQHEVLAWLGAYPTTGPPGKERGAPPKASVHKLRKTKIGRRKCLTCGSMPTLLENGFGFDISFHG